MFVIEKILLYEERHEATVLCEGKHRITIPDLKRLGLEEGMSLGDEEFARLLQAEEYLSCMQKALSVLDYGDVSKRKMIEKLRAKFPRELSEEIADYLESRGYLNDRNLARRYAENYHDLRQYGVRRIREELFSKGFSRDVIDEALEPYQNEDTRETIAELITKKYRKEELSDPVVKRKAVAWLTRNGYSWQEISNALRLDLD